MSLEMKSLVCITPGRFEYKTSPIPIPGPNEALIKIARVGVCGTDIHAFEGTQPYFEYPRILGHEVAALFVSGDAPGFTAGEAVTIVPYFNCHDCASCRINKSNCCENLKVCGVHTDGALAEYLVVPSHSLVKSNGLSLDMLSIVEPLAIGAHGINRAAVKDGEYVLVIGAGPIGIGIMEMARLAGGVVICMDVNANRLQFVREYLGVELIVNPLKDNVNETLKEMTKGAFPAVVIDATGNRQAIQQGFNYVSHGGRYVLVGLQKEEITFSHPYFHKREMTLMSSRNALRSDFDYVIDALLHKKIRIDNYITQRVGFNDAATVFPSFLKPGNNVIKAIIEFGQQL